LLSPNRTFEIYYGKNPVPDCVELTDIGVQQRESTIRLVGFDDEFAGAGNLLGGLSWRTPWSFTSTPRRSNLSIGIARSMPLIIQPAIEARKSSAGMNASGRPPTSVAAITGESRIPKNG
jgi:hypothetical protein